jgi:hypothetical protein
MPIHLGMEPEQLIASMPRPILDGFWLLVAARQGDRETALRYLEMFVEQHKVSFGAIRGDPAFASLASEPRYQAVLARMGVAAATGEHGRASSRSDARMSEWTLVGQERPPATRQPQPNGTYRLHRRRCWT